MLLLVAALVACTPARRWAPGEDVVRRIRFVGNGGPWSGHSDRDLRTPMAQRGTRFGLMTWPFSAVQRPHVLEHALLDADRVRVQVQYAHRGWFDAQMGAWELRRVRRATDRKAGVVDVVGRVEPRERSRVRTMWIDGLPMELGDTGRALLLRGPVQEGAAFDLATADAARDELLGRLRDAGRPYATAETQVEAWPAEGAVDVRIEVDAGPASTFGPVTVTGLDTVPERAVRGALTFRSGDPWSQRSVSASRRELAELGVFSVIGLQPDLSDRERTAVPVALSLTEGRMRRLRLGGGVEFDGVQLAPRLTAGFRHANVLHRVVRVDVDTSIGAATSFDEAGSAALTPTYEALLSLRLPRLGGRDVSLVASGGIEQDVQSGLFGFRRPSAALLATAEPSRTLTLRVGPRFEQYTYLVDSNVQRQAARRSFGADFTNPYQLFQLEQGLAWDVRDDPLRPTRGSRVALGFRQAVPLDPEDYAFVGASLDLRHLVPLAVGWRERTWVVALAARGEWIEPTRDRGVPWPEQVFLGGASDMRGFRQDQIGPYDTLCAEDPFALPGEDDVDLVHLPHGGTLGATAGAELRVDLGWGVGLATFVDVAALAPRVEGLTADSIRSSVGVGTRYDTAIGPLRFDVSARPLYPEDFGPVDVIDCAAGQAQPRVSDFFSSFSAWRGTEQHPPLAVVFFLAIGEAR